MSSPLPLSKAVEVIDWEHDIQWANGVSYDPSPVVNPGVAVAVSQGSSSSGTAVKRPSPNSAPSSIEFKRPSGKVLTSKRRRRTQHDYDAVTGPEVLYYPLRSTARGAQPHSAQLNTALLSDKWTPLLPPALPQASSAQYNLPNLTADLPLRASALGQMVAATWTAHGFRAALRGGVPWLRPGVLAPAVGGGADAGAVLGTGITGELLISHSKPAMQLHPALYPMLTHGRLAYRTPPQQPLSHPSSHGVTGTQSVVLTDGRRTVDVLYGVSDDTAASAEAAADASKAEGDISGVQSAVPTPVPPTSTSPDVDLTSGVAPPLRPIPAAQGPTAEAMEGLLPAARSLVTSRLAVRGLAGGSDKAKAGGGGRAAPSVLPVSGPVSFDSVHGLSARWGDLVLLEYIEESPLVLSGPGMSSHITTYWLPTAPMHRALRRRAATGKRPLVSGRDWDENDADLLQDEADGQPAPGEGFGEGGAEEEEEEEDDRPGITRPPVIGEGTLHVLESAKRFQMLGTIAEGEWITTVENKLFVAPTFEHISSKAGVEFLLVMSKTDPPPEGDGGEGSSDRNAQWVITMRKLPPLFAVGQVEPRMAFLSGKAELSSFLENWAQLTFARLAHSSNVPNLVSRRDLLQALGPELGHPRMLELLLSDVARFEAANDGWRSKVPLSPDTLLAQSSLLSPEAACIWHAIRLGMWALRRRGVRVFTEVEDAKAAWRTLRLLEQALRDTGARAPVLQGLLDATSVLQQVLQTTPWCLAEDYVKVFLQGGVGSLTLDGPQGSRAGDPSGCGEGFSFVRDPMYKQRQAGARNTTTKEGTQLDKRKLTINQLVEQLMKMGVQQAAVRGLSRWSLVQKYKQVVNSRQIAGDMIQGVLLDADALEHVSTDLRSAAEKKAAKEAQAAVIQEAQLAALAAREPPQLEDGGLLDDYDDDGQLERELAVQHANQAGDGEGLSEQAERSQWLKSFNEDTPAPTGTSAAARTAEPQLNAAEKVLPVELRTPPAPVQPSGGPPPAISGATLQVACAPVGPATNDPHEADVVSMLHTLVWHHVQGLHFRHLRTRIMTVSVDDAGKEIVRVTFGRNKWDVRAAWLKQVTGVDLYAVNRRTNLGRKSKYDKAVAEREQARLAACLRALTELRVPDNADPSRLVSFAAEYKFAVGATQLRLGASRSVPVCSACRLFGHNSGKCPVFRAQAMGHGTAGGLDVQQLSAQFRAQREAEGLAAAAAGGEEEEEEEAAEEGAGDEEQEHEAEALLEAVAPPSLFRVFPHGVAPGALQASRSVKTQLAWHLEQLVLMAAAADSGRMLRGVPPSVMGEQVYHASLAAEDSVGTEHIDLNMLRAQVLNGDVTDVDGVYVALAQIQDNMFAGAKVDGSLLGHYSAAERVTKSLRGAYDEALAMVAPLQEALERAEEDGRNTDLLFVQDTLVRETAGGASAYSATAGSGAASGSAYANTPADQQLQGGLSGDLEGDLEADLDLDLDLDLDGDMAADLGGPAAGQQQAQADAAVRAATVPALAAAGAVPPVDMGEGALDSLDEALAADLACSDSDSSEDEVLAEGQV